MQANPDRNPERAGDSPANFQQTLRDRYSAVRELTTDLAEPLSAEDCSLQSMPDASPVKWHLAHTSWFFETFVLGLAIEAYRPFDPEFRVLFNSYYNGVGDQHPRPDRGLLSRPTLDEIRVYRAHVDRHMQALLNRGAPLDEALIERIVLGLNHEQQHQELILTDIKHLLSLNPLLPSYKGRAWENPLPLPLPLPGRSGERRRSSARLSLASESRRHETPPTSPGAIPGSIELTEQGAFADDRSRPADDAVREEATAGTQPLIVTNGETTDSRLVWVHFPEGLRRIGFEGNGFSFDNERPRHRIFLEAFEMRTRPVTNGEFLAFIEAGGYRQAELWLSEGWDMVRARGWSAPLYWIEAEGVRGEFTLAGAVPLELDAPVCHVSYYEADAFARWAGARLPTEAEWEIAADTVPVTGNFLDSGRLHPAPASAYGPLRMFGDVWEWTQSPYNAYPRYRPLEGALGEYNGKFMCNQFVLRGGSCATPGSHIRSSYRNFFPPAARWQFSGIRLARDPE